LVSLMDDPASRRKALRIHSLVFGRSGDPRDRFGIELPDNPTRSSNDAAALRNDPPSANEGPRSHAATATDTRSVEDACSHSDERLVADRASMENNPVPDRALCSNIQGQAIIGMQDAIVLHVATRPDRDPLAVTPENRAKPY